MNETLGTMPPPDGVTPQFHGPFTDKQKQIFSAAVADVTLSTVFIALRLYTRGGIVGSFGMDDCESGRLCYWLYYFPLITRQMLRW
jgi:hypothetical protein